MPYNLYTQSFGQQYKNVAVKITDFSGNPAIILARSNGGVISRTGDTFLDGNGDLNVYLDSAKQWNVVPASRPDMVFDSNTLADDLYSAGFSYEKAVSLAAKLLPEDVLSAVVGAYPTGLYTFSATDVTSLKAIILGGGGGGGGGNPFWGGILGTLSNQTDLVNALGAKVNTSIFTSFGTSFVGAANSAAAKVQLALNNVDNTSDATKAAAGNPVGDAIALKFDSSALSTFGKTFVALADAAAAKSNLGLGNVNNTSDATKAATGNPIGDAIALKLNSSAASAFGLTILGSADAAALKTTLTLNNVNNTSDATKAAAGNPVGDAIAAKYTKPGSGIPASDLASAVQASLSKADAAGNQGVPSAEASDRVLTSADNGKNLICSGTRIFTVNTGLPSGFGVSIKGTVSFAGSATVTDVRSTGSTSPWCALIQTGTDAYDVVGGKA